MVDYCAPSDVYGIGGVPRGSVPNPGRAVAFHAADDTAELGTHGLALNDLVSFRAEAGGTLPLPLVPNIYYFAIPGVTDDVFQISDTLGGAAIDLETDGSRVLAITPSPIALAITWASRIIDESLPTIAPLALPVPEIVRITCAELAGGRLLIGSTSKSLGDMVDAANKRMVNWARGQRPRNDANQKPANLAVAADGPAPLNAPSLDCGPNSWHRFGGL